MGLFETKKRRIDWEADVDQVKAETGHLLGPVYVIFSHYSQGLRQIWTEEAAERPPYFNGLKRKPDQ
jgi:hypothetical protein